MNREIDIVLGEAVHQLCLTLKRAGYGIQAPVFKFKQDDDFPTKSFHIEIEPFYIYEVGTPVYEIEIIDKLT